MNLNVVSKFYPGYLISIFIGSFLYDTKQQHQKRNEEQALDSYNLIQVLSFSVTMTIEFVLVLADVFYAESFVWFLFFFKKSYFELRKINYPSSNSSL